MTATARNAARQPRCWPMQVHSGTPTTREAVRPPKTAEMARACLDSSTRLIASAAATLAMTAWATAVISRVAISSWTSWAAALTRFPAINTAMSATSRCLRFIRADCAVTMSPPAAMPTA